MKLMNWRAYRRTVCSKGICVVSALLMLASALVSSCCFRLCSLHTLGPQAACSAMDSMKDTEAVRASCSPSWCQVTQNPPATIDNGAPQLLKVGPSISVVLPNLPRHVALRLRIGSTQLNSSPPTDVQSSLCTLLI
jgi:hypothetical protein